MAKDTISIKSDTNQKRKIRCPLCDEETIQLKNLTKKVSLYVVKCSKCKKLIEILVGFDITIGMSEIDQSDLDG